MIKRSAWPNTKLKHEANKLLIGGDKESKVWMNEWMYVQDQRDCGCGF
jgi:hypothetical protein